MKKIITDIGYLVYGQRYQRFFVSYVDIIGQYEMPYNIFLFNGMIFFTLKAKN